MKKRRRKGSILHPKYIFILLSIFCVVIGIVSLRNSESTQGIKTSLGEIISPMQNGINSVGSYLYGKTELFRSKESLLEKNKELQSKVDDLSYQNKILAGENVELESYRTLFSLDKKYPDYPKVAARVISRDSNNWYNVFTINKGSEDGIQVDYNVIAGNGLVGIVAEVGKHYAKVRSIIDDKSNVSAMFMESNENCMVKGNLESIYRGYIDVEMISSTSEVKEGAEVVTSQISSKFLPGILIGYIKDITEDTSKLTKTAHLTPVVPFDSLDIVLVITQKKDPVETGEQK